MNDFNKAKMDIDGDSIHWSVPFEKNSVNEEKREVSGFATLDNVDSQGDVVLAEASKDAFARCRGNIREMHQPSAVGTLKNFVEKTVWDDMGNMYTGIYVTVHISKGAQDAWEKVKDGTYTGFSIGGNIKDAETQWVKDANRNIRFIKSYDLAELSIVDNPANQMANMTDFAKVFSITTSADGGTIVKGMITEVRKQNAFWCNEHKISEVSDDTNVTCGICKSEMVPMGPISINASQEEMGALVKKFLGIEGGVNTMAKSEDTNTDNGEKVVDKTTEVEEAGHSAETVDAANTVQDNGLEGTKEEVEPTLSSVDADKAKEEAAAAHDETSDATNATNTDPVLPIVNQDGSEEAEAQEKKRAEEAAEFDETAENDLEKIINDLKDAISKSVEDSREIAKEASRKFEETFTKSLETLTDQVTETKAKYEELSKVLETVKADQNETRKSLEVLSGNTAFKKSGEVESPAAVTTKGGTFSGVFLSTDDL